MSALVPEEGIPFDGDVLYDICELEAQEQEARADLFPRTGLYGADQ